MSERDTTSADTGAAQPKRIPAGQIKQARVPKYDFTAIESRWRARWEQQKLYQVDLQQAARPYYNLMMFPYPSAEGLHVGNMYSYVGSDIHGRWMAMQGYDVFEPMGFDAFGIHSENFAIARGIHPRILTGRNVEHFREQQLKRVGNRFDWSHEVHTTDPAYYRWTQWIFVQLFKNGLAERKTAPVKWCPKDKTVLADEQVIDGHCERCGTLVERRWLEQWFLKITNYAGRLLDNLEWLDWSERVKALQRNWIGRSQGLEFSMQIDGRSDLSIQVYTTRPDTIFGMTFVALSPQHPLIMSITDSSRLAAITAYQQAASRLYTDAERLVTGVFTGAYALHPLTGERIPSQQPEQRASIRVPAVLLPLATFSTIVPVVLTGVRTFPATRASGVLAITNGSILAQHLPAGMLMTASNGMTVVTTASVDVPAGNGTTYGIAYVSAQAVSPGAKGNLPAFALQVVYGTSLFLRNERAFTGGQDAYSVPVMTPQDRQRALAQARGILLPQTLSGLLLRPCLEHVTGTTSLHIAWTCQFVTYTTPSLPQLRVLQAQVIGRIVFLTITYVPRPQHLETK